MRPPTAPRRSPLLALIAGAAALVVGTRAQAEPTGPQAAPSVNQCLAASDASFKAANEHRLRAERAQLLVCAAPSCPGEVRAECLRRVDKVNRQIPTVVFSAQDEHGADLGVVRIAIDHDVVTDHSAGLALELDPGEHTFDFESPGRAPVDKELVIVEGQKGRAERVVFSVVPVVEPASHWSSSRRWLAAGVGGAGVVGLGLGAAFGIVALEKKRDANKECPSRTCATQSQVDAWSSASHAGTTSTVFFIAGGALLAGGAVLWVTSPSHHDASVGAGPGQLTFRTKF
jgi:hypothetical protein